MHEPQHRVEVTPSLGINAARSLDRADAVELEVHHPVVAHHAGAEFAEARVVARAGEGEILPAQLETLRRGRRDARVVRLAVPAPGREPETGSRADAGGAAVTFFNPSGQPAWKRQSEFTSSQPSSSTMPSSFTPRRVTSSRPSVVMSSSTSASVNFFPQPRLYQLL